MGGEVPTICRVSVQSARAFVALHESIRTTRKCHCILNAGFCGQVGRRELWQPETPPSFGRQQHIRFLMSLPALSRMCLPPNSKEGLIAALSAALQSKPDEHPANSDDDEVAAL
jgi:hypothetical protein